MLESQCLFDKTFSSSVFRMGREGGKGGLPVRLCVVDVPVQVESNEAGKCFVVVVVVGIFFYYEVIPRSLESHLRFKVVILSWLEVG